ADALGSRLRLNEAVPKVTDFGLAKVEAGASAALPPTQSGALLGTPAYMAPEQAVRRNKEGGPAAGVYALGVTRCELLPGRPPCRGETAWDTLVQVREQEPRPPRALNPRVDRGLEAVCLKCLEKAPQGRYASAHALASDLRNWLAGEPILA